MVISTRRLGPALSAHARSVTFSADMLQVLLEDGRRISVPIVWFPRLVEATEKQRNGWKLIGRGIGIHWEALDEDISVENLLATRTEDLAGTDTSLPGRRDLMAGLRSAIETARRDKETATTDTVDNATEPSEPSATPLPSTTL